MKFLYTFIVLVFIIFCANSCNIINPTEPVPTYVHVDSFSFSGVYSKTATNSHKITCVYVYLNGQSIGIFDLPVTFPVIIDKKSTLQFTPGYDYNGLSGVPTQYPFYLSAIDSLEPAPGQTIIKKPATSYYSQTKLVYSTDFEGSNPFGGVSVDDTNMIKTNVDSFVFEGHYAGLIYLNAQKDSSVNVSTDTFYVSPLTDVSLEINYRSTVPFTIGLYTNSAGIDRLQYLAGFNPHPGWNKAYVDLKTFVNTFKSTKYALLIRAIKDDPQKGKDGFVAVDNIKIVSF